MKRQRPFGIRAAHAAKKRKTQGQFVRVPTKPRVFVPRTLGNPMAVTETKYVDGAIELTALADLSADNAVWTGTELDMVIDGNAQVFRRIDIGDGHTQRDGRKVLIKKIRIKGTIRVAVQSVQAVPDRAGIVRLVLYQDTQTNGVQAQGEDVLASAGGSNTEDSAINTFMNPLNFSRFRVLKDKIIRLQQPQLTGAAAVIEQAGYEIPFSFSLRPNAVQQFDSTGNGIADVVDNSWHLIGARNGTLAASITYQSRVYFEG